MIYKAMFQDIDRAFIRGCYSALGPLVIYVDLYGKAHFVEDAGLEVCAEVMAGHFNRGIH